MSRFWKPSSGGTIALKSTRPTVVTSHEPFNVVDVERSAVWNHAFSDAPSRLRRRRVRQLFASTRANSRRRLGREVAAEHDVLRRLGDRTTVRRLEDVVRRQHQQAALELRLERQRHVHRHLVAVEVGVERRAHERMNTDGLALDEHRLERLDAQR